MASGDRKILKNTLLLYIRMGFTMLISLYTSRVILIELGISDFGVQSLVATTVTIINYLNSTMMQTVQRFLNASLGKKDDAEIQKIFSIAQFIYFVLTGIFFVLAETIGLSLLNGFVKIPADRLAAANIIFQISVISNCITILSAPVGAVITAFERFDFFAMLSIGQSVFKLAMAIMLKIVLFDKLIFYSIAEFSGHIFFTALMFFYFYRSFGKKIHFRFVYSPHLLKQMATFSGWSLFGSLANLSAIEGLSILTNYFFGVIANTVMGIASRISGIFYQFIGNIQMAFTPQLIQRYTARNHKAFFELIYRSSKISFFILLIPAVPLLLNTKFILDIWLVKYPPETVSVVQLVIFYTLLDVFSYPLRMSVQATGNIKKYQILVSAMFFTILPISAIVLHFGGPLWSVMLLKVIVNAFIIIWRIFFLKKLIRLPSWHFFLMVFCRGVLSGSVILVSLFAFRELYLSPGWLCLFTTTLLSFFLITLIGWFGGMNAKERQLITIFIRDKISKKTPPRKGIESI